MVAFIFLPFFAQNVETILAGAILQGIPWGVFQTLTVTYASEVRWRPESIQDMC